jgi:hypothetical protein
LWDSLENRFDNLSRFLFSIHQLRLLWFDDSRGDWWTTTAIRDSTPAHPDSRHQPLLTRANLADYVGEMVKGFVIAVTTTAAFVEIGPGLVGRGLLPRNKESRWGSHSLPSLHRRMLPLQSRQGFVDERVGEREIEGGLLGWENLA